MKKICKVFGKIFKFFLKALLFVALCLVGFVITMEIDIKLAEGEKKLEAIELREYVYAMADNYYHEAVDWCGNVFEDTKQWCSNAAKDVKNWFANTVENVKNFFAKNKDDEIGVDGAKLTEVSSYELCNYTDFTIPYGWTVGKVSSEDPATQEAIMLSKNTITMVVSLKNVEAPKTREALHWTREAMIFDMKSKYNDYIFESLDIIEDKAAIIGIKMPNAETTLYMAIVAAGERTIVVTCQFERVDFVEGEIYFQVALAEMVKNLK